ncbi:hypothetical protein T439DRAFT_204920 [Meredithblackwellia eburnea MCA 4105]
MEKPQVGDAVSARVVPSLLELAGCHLATTTHQAWIPTLKSRLLSTAVPFSFCISWIPQVFCRPDATTNLNRGILQGGTARTAGDARDCTRGRPIAQIGGAEFKCPSIKHQFICEPHLLFRKQPPKSPVVGVDAFLSHPTCMTEQPPAGYFLLYQPSQSHLATSPCSPSSFITEHFLPPSDEALIIKLQGLTRSLSPLGRHLIAKLDHQVLRKAVRFTEDKCGDIITVKAWGPNSVEGICNARIPPREQGTASMSEELLGSRSLHVRVQAMADELGLSIPRRTGNGALVPTAHMEEDEDTEDEDMSSEEGDDVEFTIDVEDVDLVTHHDHSGPDSFGSATVRHHQRTASEAFAPSSGVFHQHTLPLSLPPPGRRGSPPLPTPSSTTVLSHPTPRAGRTVQGLGPGWAEASQQFGAAH